MQNNGVRWLIHAIIPGLLILACCHAQARDILQISIPPAQQSEDAHDIYYAQLLQLALSKTEAADGPFIITEYPHSLNNARYTAEIQRNGVVNVIWAVTNIVRETEMLPIRISILKDLNSYRVFLIRKEDLDNFKKINTLDDLRHLKAGQGTHWQDTNILLANNLPVVTSTEFELLFNMLIAHRFDYLPRGLDEVWREEKKYSDKGLIIEPHVMLHYTAPKYFFVNKNNKALAERIERGLKIAIADGSFDKLFNSIPAYRRGLEEVKANKRLMLTLQSQWQKND